MRKIGWAALTVIVLMSLVPAAGAQGSGEVIESKTFISEQRFATWNGSADAGALHIAIEGIADDPPLTVGTGSGAAAFSRALEVKSAPVIPRDLFVACTEAGSVALAGTESCLGQNELQQRGLTVGEDDRVAISTLVERGIASLVQVSRQDDIRDKAATASAQGVVIPNLASAVAECSGTESASAEGMVIPDALSGVLTGSLAAATCSTSVDQLPTVTMGSGEVDLAVTLTQTLVANLPVNATLDQIQQGVSQLPAPLSDPANTLIDNLQQNLESEPLVEVAVAPNGGVISSVVNGMTATANARAVTIAVLGQPLDAFDPQVAAQCTVETVLCVTIGVADTVTSIVDDLATAEAGIAFAHVRALDIADLVPDSDFLIDQTLESPVSSDETILAGTPLQSTIRVASGRAEPASPTPCPRPATGATERCTASAEAEALSLSLFETDGLPAITVRLAGAGSNVTQDLQGAPVPPELPVASLPRTGPAAMATGFYGFGLIGLAALVRRRLWR